MSCLWLCSDWHLTHRNMAMKYRPGWSSIEEHDQYLIEQWKLNVTKRDKVICLGDMATSKAGIDMMMDLPGERHLILGNHDLDNDCNLLDLMNAFDNISGPYKHKEFWLTHFPIHTNELLGKYNFHGHVHGNNVNDTRYLNICPENIVSIVDRPLIKLQEARQLIRERNQ